MNTLAKRDWPADLGSDDPLVRDPAIRAMREILHLRLRTALRDRPEVTAADCEAGKEQP